MKPKTTAKLICDVLMTIALLLLMAYEMVGEAAHEWIGAGMLVLFVMHHILNFHWCKRILKGRYSAFRVFQTLIAAAILACMIGLAYSGILLSRHVLAFLPTSGSRSLARTMHMLCAYWGFALMGVHLGLYWKMVMGIAGRGAKPSASKTMCLRIVGVCIAVYGFYAFVTRQFGTYMLLRSRFVFFDYGEPIAFFLIDYTAIMGSFVAVGHYIAKAAR
ncbi:MAG: DUF4405 domain-containing protein [Butyricicoccaceae bacterium]